MPKKKYNNYDNTLFGRYIRQIENPDSIGWDSSSRIWRQSTRKGDDERNRGMGIDVLNNKAAKKLTQDRVGGFLTEEDERQLRNEYLQEMLNVIDRQKAKHPGLNNMSPRKQAEVIGALYRGDAPKLWDKSTILGKALESPNEEDFHRAIDTYYNSVGLGERARNNDKFWSNQTHSNQSPHVPSPTITRQIDGMVFPTMPSSQPTITKQDVIDAAMLGPKAVAAGVGTVANYINQAVQKYVKPKDNSKDNTVRWAEGGFLKPKDAWDSLSMKDKADMIGIAVKHGITTLSDIRDKYNEFAEGGGMEESMNTIPEDYAPLASPTWQRVIDKMKQDSYKSNVEDFAYRVQKMHPEITQQQVEEAYKSVPIIASDSRRGRETGKYVYGDESGYGQRIMLYPNRMKEDQGVGGLTREDQLRSAMGHETNHLYVHTLLGGNYTDEEKALLDAAYPDDLFHVPEGGNIYDEKRAYNMQIRKALSEAYGNLVGADYDKATEKMKPDDVMWNYSQLGAGYMSDYQKVKQKYKKGSKWDQKQVDAILKATKDVAYTPTVNPYEYEEGVNYAALGGPIVEAAMNEYKNGGYKPSENIKKRISRWEGDAMVKDTIDPLSGKMAKKNRTFEEVTRGFVRALPSSIAERVLSNPELADNLYSYAYNVGPGNFKKRVVPVLQRYYNGDATVDDVTSSMWASGDKKLRGLRNRRAEEKAGVRNALLGHAATSTVLEPTTPALVATNSYVSSPYPLLTEEVQPTPLFYHIEDRSTDISPSPEELERQERKEALNRFNTVMSLIGIKNPLAFYTSEAGNPFIDTLELFANESANGGKIHIKPSKKGTFTAAAKKHGMGVQQFASRVLAHPKNYSPAMRKKANFARNARKWKHGLGGNLFSGEEEDSQKMQMGLRVTNGWKPFTLGDVLANAAKIEQQRQAMEDRFSNDLVLSNDATSIANGRPQNRHLERRAVEGAKAHAAWEEEHPIATEWGNVLGAVPLVVASWPFVGGAVVPSATALGDAAASTATGQALTSALTPIATATTTKLAGAPALGWANAGLQSLMAVHGLNTAVEEGGVSPTTALELSPLVQPIVGIGNNLYLPHLREHIYASKAPIGYDGVRKAAGRIAEGVLSGRRADIENPFWFNPKSAETLQSYAFVPNSVQGAEREQYLKEFGEKALRARADIWRMYNRLPQKYNTFIKSEKFPEAYTAPNDIKALHWVPQPKEYIDPGDFVNSVGGNVGLPEITNLGRGIPEPGYSSKEFGVTTLTDLWDLHPFSRPGDRLINRLKRQWNSSTYKTANAIRKVVGSNYIKDGSGTYIPVPNSHTYITKLEDVDLFDTGASIGQVQSTSPTLISKTPSKIAQRTANKILKLADKVENIEAPNFTILKPIDNKLAKFEIGRLFGGKPVLVKNEIPWTMDRKFIDTEGNIGFQSSWTQGFNSANILPQSVIDWKRGYSSALLEEPNINPDIFKYLTR